MLIIFKILKAIVYSVFGVVAIISIAGLVYWFDISENRGYEFGYYGEFNHITNCLLAIDGVEIVDDWFNPDVFLEEFGFSIKYKNQDIELFFASSDSIRKMSDADSTNRLRSMLKHEYSRES